MPYRPRSKEPPKIPESYFVLEVAPEAMQAIEGIAKMPSVPQAIRELLTEAVKYSYEVELPLGRMAFEWLEMEAERQGCTWEDILWDRAHAKGPSGL